MFWLLSGFSATLFLLAAAGKSFGFAEFAAYLAELGIPVMARHLIAVAVICIEACLAVALGVGNWTPLAAYVASSVSAVFVALQIRNVLQRSSGCSCFGAVDRGLDPGLALTRASILLVATLVLSQLSVGNQSVVGRLPDTLGGVLVALTLLATIALLNQARLVMDFDRRRRERVASVQLQGDST